MMGAWVCAVVVNGNSGNDVVRMEASGSQTIVNGDDGDDITDFSFTNHNVANLSGSTVVNGGNGNDSIFIYDLADANPDLFIVNSVGVLRANWGGAYPQSDLENITLYTGTAANTVLVLSTNAGQHWFLNSAGGQDTVKIGDRTSRDGDSQQHRDPQRSEFYQRHR